MNDSCFKATTEFDTAEQEFVKFPDNMCGQVIFMNITKTVQDSPSPIRNRILRNINRTYTKFLTSEINKRFILSSGQLSNPYREILLAISQTVTIQTHVSLTFKSHHCDVIDNSQTL